MKVIVPLLLVTLSQICVGEELVSAVAPCSLAPHTDCSAERHLRTERVHDTDVLTPFIAFCECRLCSTSLARRISMVSMPRVISPATWCPRVWVWVTPKGWAHRKVSEEHSGLSSIACCVVRARSQLTHHRLLCLGKGMSYKGSPSGKGKGMPSKVRGKSLWWNYIFIRNQKYHPDTYTHNRSSKCIYRGKVRRWAKDVSSIWLLDLERRFMIVYPSASKSIEEHPRVSFVHRSQVSWPNNQACCGVLVLNACFCLWEERLLQVAMLRCYSNVSSTSRILRFNHQLSHLFY